MTEKTRTQVRIDEPLWIKLSIIADKSRRSTNAELQIAIEQYVRQYETEHGIIFVSESTARP